MASTKFSRWVTAGYVFAVLIAACAATVRLLQSTEMPGLAAFELVLLALPWAFALAVEPMARFDWGGMTAIVIGGLVLNALLIHFASRWLQRKM
jgi:hypothetical protein